MTSAPPGKLAATGAPVHTGPSALPVTRRDFLRTAARVAVAAGSATALGSLVPRWSAGVTSEADGRNVPVPWRTLATSLTGRLVRSGEPTLQADAQLSNERFDGIRPEAVVYCESVEDVQRCVDFARRHGVRIAARSGGHSYGGYSACRGLVVDVTPMSGVRVAPSGRRATVGAGTRLIDVYDALGTNGVLLPGGSCPTVGIAGLALGGGVGIFSRRYGLTCDQLAAVRIVTADGLVLNCDRSHHEDLFWACQGGGGGNFGIVTSFVFDVHPLPPIALFTLEWPWSATVDVLGAWLEWTGGAPDEVWSNCQLLSSGAAGGANPTTVRVTGVFCGTATTLAALLGPLRNASAPRRSTTSSVPRGTYEPCWSKQAARGRPWPRATYPAGT